MNGHSLSDTVNAREECAYKNLNNQFAIQKDEYSRQFSHIYTLRLNKMRSRVEQIARSRWGSDVPILQLFQLQEREQTMEKCIIIGTLYKEQCLKPNIVKEISEEYQLDPQPLRTQFTDDSDSLILEDDQQRISLIGHLDPQTLLTGVTCALLGHDGQEGKFEVEDSCFAQAEEHVYRPLPGSERFILLISGLGVAGARAAEAQLGAELLLEWLTGEAGCDGEQAWMAKVARIIVAGNSLQENPLEEMMARKLHSIEADTKAKLLSSMNQLDSMLAELAESVDVDLMPGEFDPGNHMLPQQPLHHCLLPLASRYTTMHSVSNPYQSEVAGRILLGTSGQPLKDMARLCTQEDRLELLHCCLKWGHISPTSPDTLASFPCYSDDPFIMEKCPDIFFAGNQPEFQTKLIKAENGQPVRLICLPSFSQTLTCALVNLHTLDCQPLQFGNV